MEIQIGSTVSHKRHGTGRVEHIASTCNNGRVARVRREDSTCYRVDVEQLTSAVKPMLEIPHHPRYDEWSTQSYTADTFPCVICGKPIKDTKVKHRVYVDNGGQHLLSPEAAAAHPENYKELGMWPIGTDCLRQHPELAPYVVSSGELAAESQQ